MQSSVKKTLIGAVPDRGGRVVNTGRPQMPQLKARVEGPPTSYRGGRRGGSGKGKQKGGNRNESFDGKGKKGRGKKGGRKGDK